MKISTPIAAAGHRAITRIAFPRATLDECTNEDGKIDAVKGQLAFTNDKFSGFRPFRQAKDDDEFVYFVALTLFEALHNAYEDVSSRQDSGISNGAVCKQDELNQRKFERGKFVYACVHITRKAETVRVRFSVDNPNEVVGEAEIEAREFLTACAEICLRMKASVRWLEIEKSEIVEEAERRNRAAELRVINERRLMCKCRTRTGFCSPCHPKCKFYERGMCVEITEA